MSNMLGVFPLNIVILPEESVALHLFETRYRELYHDHKNGKEFVIVFSDKSGISTHASTVFIDKVVNEFPDGTVDVIVKGKSVVKIDEFVKLFPGKLYSGVRTTEVILDGQASIKLHEQFKCYLDSINKDIKKSSPLTIFYIANRLKLGVEVKNELLKQKDSAALDRFLINEIKFIQKLREQEENLNHKFHLN